MARANQCLIPLWEKPTLLQIGTAHHGTRPIETYRLPGIWCLHYYTYAAELRADRQHFSIQPGSVTLLPPDMELHYRYAGPSTHQFAHFVLPTADTRLCVLPLYFSPGRVPPGFQGKFLEAVRLRGASPEHAAIRVWDLLWDLADTVQAAPGDTPFLPPAVAKALAWIESHLSDPIRIPDLAREVGLSQNQLNRLFHRHLGHNIITAIRRRRSERAIHLLRNTDLSLRTIATASGLGDSHSFNRTIRAMTRHSPTAIRRQGPTRFGPG
ncbi:MAG: AraC family transcriptional regulator [Opitutaceae bacterium]